MSDATVIKPDLQFVNDIIKGGGESLKKCYQCATCSVVCNVTPDESPFPRKEMVLAQWGQKDQLITSPDVWLCHQCSDCTAYCPRGAKPGEVLNAIRKQSIKHVAMVPLFAKIATEPKLIWLLFAIPMALLYVVLMILGTQISTPCGQKARSWRTIISCLFPRSILFSPSPSYSRRCRPSWGSSGSGTA